MELSVSLREGRDRAKKTVHYFFLPPKKLRPRRRFREKLIVLLNTFIIMSSEYCYTHISILKQLSASFYSSDQHCPASGIHWWIILLIILSCQKIRERKMCFWTALCLLQYICLPFISAAACHIGTNRLSAAWDFSHAMTLRTCFSSPTNVLLVLVIISWLHACVQVQFVHCVLWSYKSSKAMSVLLASYRSAFGPAGC